MYPITEMPFWFHYPILKKKKKLRRLLFNNYLVTLYIVLSCNCVEYFLPVLFKLKYLPQKHFTHEQTNALIS